MSTRLDPKFADSVIDGVAVFRREIERLEEYSSALEATIAQLESDVEVWKTENRRNYEDKLRLEEALKPFANINASDGDTFQDWPDDEVIIRCEVTVAEIKEARAALEKK